MPRLSRAFIVVALALSACSTPVGVREERLDAIYRSLNSNVLLDGKPSASSQMLLAYVGKEEQYRYHPAETLDELEELNYLERRRLGLIVMAELSYHLALRERSKQRFLSSAIYAYLYLFDESVQPAVNKYSAQFRLACDLYNNGLVRALLNSNGEVELVDEDVQTSAGRIVITAVRPGFPWGEEVFSRFLPADAFEVRGLRERVRDSGLGVPLIAIQTKGTDTGVIAEPAGESIELPATAFLRLNGGLDELFSNRLTATIELYLSTDFGEVVVGAQTVPLQTDFTAPIAHSLEEAKVWDFGLTGFLRGDTEDFRTGVFLLEPFQQGKIPLVFIHGTASSPATWAQTVNGLYLDPRLRSRYQVWLAQYNTGNPIAYSASIIRDSLRTIMDDLDPEGTDPALSNMVLVGHSQGGLVARFLITKSEDHLWNTLFDDPFESYTMQEDAREVLSSALFFEPLSFVSRCIFISTPHRGSFAAGGWLGSLASSMVKMPRKLTELTLGLLQGGDLPEELLKIPTSVDEMRPDDPFAQRLGSLSFNEEVDLHSIIAVKPYMRSIERGNDGVVTYKSAHLDEAKSELVVRYSHSCQGAPEVILEIRRILYEHLQKFDQE